MTPGLLRQWLAEGRTVPLFAVARLPHPLIVEMFGLAGQYRGFWIDQEHAEVSTDQLFSLALAARANEMDCFVRMAPTGYWQVTQCLEAGAGGVMAAQIHSVAQAEEFAGWCKFAPEGTRGLNSSGYDARYTHTPLAEFAAQANRHAVVGIQVETLGALEQADAIAALPNVDFLFVGPADLSLCLGVVGEFHSDRLWEAIGQVAAACQRHGKTWGCVAPDPEFAVRAVEQGCRLPTIGNDALVLRRGIETLQQSFPAVFKDCAAN